MRGKDYNTGLRGVLFEARHYERMGAAVWLYGWLVLRQTRQQDSIGWVLGGAPISYREIEEETGFNRRTLERWMQILRRQGYIETEAAGNGVSVRITKAKKFPQFPQGGRRNAEGGREAAEGAPQKCVASDGNPQWKQQSTDKIGSSFVGRYKEDKPNRKIHRVLHNSANFQDPETYPHKSNNQTAANQPLENHSCLEQTQSYKYKEFHEIQQSQGHPDQRHGMETNVQSPERYLSPRQFFAEARLRLELLRAEREEAVRRELHVGTGPEVNRR